jgi:hypothetical protein
MKKQKKSKSTKTTRSKSKIVVGVLALTAILGITVAALLSSHTAKAQQQSLDSQPQAENEDVTIQYANQNITIDPVTGKLRKPTVEEARALVNTLTGMTNRSTRGLDVEHHADGSSRVDLQGRFQNVIVAKPNPDGTSEVRCVSSMEEAASFLGVDPSKIPGKN